jgi:hypothetical protein
MKDELKKKYERNWSWPELTYCDGISLVGPLKTTKISVKIVGH